MLDFYTIEIWKFLKILYYRNLEFFKMLDFYTIEIWNFYSIEIRNFSKC